MRTPFYFYDLEILNKTLSSIAKNIADYSFKVHYALKVNAEEKLLKIHKQLWFWSRLCKWQ